MMSGGFLPSSNELFCWPLIFVSATPEILGFMIIARVKAVVLELVRLWRQMLFCARCCTACLRKDVQVRSVLYFVSWYTFFYYI